VKRFLLASLLGCLAGCYDPTTADCTVTCSGSDECASGQTCGSDGYCAAPDVAGGCVEPVALAIEIEGDGTVAIAGIGECDSRMATDHRCIYMVAPSQPRQLSATPNGDKDFKHWTSTCVGETATCVITPVTDVTRVGAKFE
jgi:hypothetical protein